MDIRKLIMVFVFAVSLSACASTGQNTAASNKLALTCDQGLDAAYKELNFSKANGFGGSWEYTKAAGLLGTASVQSSFGAYAGCINKVKTARVYIKESRQAH